MILAGCSGDGIFYALENEERIVDANNMGDHTPLDNMFIYSDGSSKYYVANGTRVWYSLVGADTNSWNTFPVPSAYSKYPTFPSIAQLDGELYATIISHEANYRSGLLKLDRATKEWVEILYDVKNDSSLSDYTYSNMYLFDTKQGLYINKVYYYKDSSEVSIKNSRLYFYATADEGTLAGADELTASHELIAGIDFPGFNIPAISAESDPQRIVDIVSGNGLESYMIYNIDGSANKNGVLAYSASNPSSFFTTPENTGTDKYDFISIYYSSVQDMVFMGTEGSSDTHPLFYKQTGADWKSKAFNNDYEFAAFCDIDSIQSKTILAGTRAFKDPSNSSSNLGDGYIEIDVTNPEDPSLQSNTFSEDNNYSSSDLEDATINNFFYDSDNDRLYAATRNYGLWLNTKEGNDREWSQE